MPTFTGGGKIWSGLRSPRAGSMPGLPFPSCASLTCLESFPPMAAFISVPCSGTGGWMCSGAGGSATWVPQALAWRRQVCPLGISVLPSSVLVTLTLSLFPHLKNGKPRATPSGTGHQLSGREASHRLAALPAPAPGHLLLAFHVCPLDWQVRGSGQVAAASVYLQRVFGRS